MASRPGKLTLLEIVQETLRSMNSEEVNSIADTQESYDVAKEVENTFYDLIGGLEEEYRKNVFQLQAVSDVNKPTYMKIPNNVGNIECLYFDYQTSSNVTWKEMCYLDPTDFIRKIMNYSGNSNAELITDPYTGVQFYILNNQDPTFYTTFDDEHIVFNSYDNTKMSTLTEIRTMGTGTILPPFEVTDTFIPPIPADMFPLLVAEVKKACFINFKQVSNSNEEVRAKRARLRRMNNLNRAKTGLKNETNFGRSAP